MRTIGAFAVALCSLAAAGVTATDQPRDDPAATFASKCAMCHGKGGGGDGAAAAALNPKPTDLTSAEYQESRTDEQIAEAISAGKGAMPSYSTQLSKDAIDGLVAYIRELGAR